MGSDGCLRGNRDLTRLSSEPRDESRRGRHECPRHKFLMANRSTPRKTGFADGCFRLSRPSFCSPSVEPPSPGVPRVGGVPYFPPSDGSPARYLGWRLPHPPVGCSPGAASTSLSIEP